MSNIDNLTSKELKQKLKQINNLLRIGLKNAKIVYETGQFESAGFKDAQDLCCNECFIKKKQLKAKETIESFGILLNKSGSKSRSGSSYRSRSWYWSD